MHLIDDMFTLFTYYNKNRLLYMQYIYIYSKLCSIYIYTLSSLQLRQQPFEKPFIDTRTM